MTYLDTHIAVDLAEAQLGRLSRQAQKAIDTEGDLRLSPMVLMELQLLYEIGRLNTGADQIARILAEDLDVRVCDASWAAIARQALAEGWTRDPFDRLILAQARLKKARLITRDERMHRQYRLALG
jgi:PIN domain nuclease of toxin-antitoxin system